MTDQVLASEASVRRMLPLIVQVEKVAEHSAQTIAFDYSPVRIGRNPLNDINLGDSFVSLWHAVVRFDSNGTYYVDLGSKNGTTVNGRRLGKNEEVRVEPSTDLRIGLLRLHLLRGEAPGELLNAARPTAFLLGGALEAPAADRTAYVQQMGSEHLVGLRNARAGLGPNAQATNPPASASAPAGVTPAAPTVRISLPAPPLASFPPSPPVASIPVASAPTPSIPVVAAHRAAPAVVGMDAAYTEYRAAFARLREQLTHELSVTAGAERAALIQRHHQRFPAMFQEPELAPLLAEAGLATDAAPELKPWLGRLTNGLYPPPMVKTNTAMTMERLGAILEVFSQAFVELRRGQKDFCHEMALEQMHENTTLYKTDDPRVVLAYLLDPTSGGSTRVNELSRAFAEFALHQVALVSGATDGARALLEQLGPEELSKAPGRDDGSSLVSRMLGGEAARLWNRFRTQHENLMEGDRFTRELFGRAFARAYFRMTGGRISHVPGP